MHDLEVPVPDGARTLARLGRVLGAAGVGLEGGGTWSRVAHYLVEDGVAARDALAAEGVEAVVRPALVVPLEADVPGALGRLMDRLVAADVVLVAQYSDHDNRKVLVPDDAPSLDRAAAALRVQS